MDNSNEFSAEIAVLNNLLSDIKILVGSLSILDSSTESKNQVLRDTALDAINFRVREISQTSMSLDLDLSVSLTQAVLAELSNPSPNIKRLHDELDTQLESLRKIALSKILNLSVE